MIERAARTMLKHNAAQAEYVRLAALGSFAGLAFCEASGAAV
jgi:hypothetical protein